MDGVGGAGKVGRPGCWIPPTITPGWVAPASSGWDAMEPDDEPGALGGEIRANWFCWFDAATLKLNLDLDSGNLRLNICC